MLKLLKSKNPDIKFYSVTDDEFSEYGRIIDGIETAEIIKAAEKIENPAEGSRYIASEPTFECLSVSNKIQKRCYGELPAQVGYCFGHNSLLNAAEWHTSDEINIAVTDLVLILAKQSDIKDGKINSQAFKAFFVPKGSVIAVYSSSLHFCPCEVSKDGFGCVVALPLGTNVPLEEEHCDKLLFRKNKWLISHVENTGLIERGAVAGIYGTNYKINY